MKMQLNPQPWPRCLGTDVATVVMQSSVADNADSLETTITDAMLLATQPDAERLAMRHAVPSRQIEFARGRHCLRQALQHIGITTAIIPVGEARQPVLPAGILGSISHCDDYVVAACTQQGNIIGLGIDVEKHQPLTPEIQKLILTSSEQQHIKHLSAAEQNIKQHATLLLQTYYWEAVIFSIKESFYKALFAVHPFYVDFLQAEVQILDAQTFSIQPLIALAQIGQKSHVGRYAVDDRYIYSSLCITQD